MSDWEEQADEKVDLVPPPFPLKVASKWDDEEEEDVLDSWDALSDQEEKKETPKVVPKATKGAKSKLDKKGATKVEEPKETEFERKQRLKKAQEDADATNVTDLFDGLNVVKRKVNPDLSLDKIVPQSKNDFDDLTSLLMDKFETFEKHPLYLTFLEGCIRQLCDRLTKSEDVKKIGSTINTIANEKLRLEKESTKKNKKASTKKQVRVEADEYSAPGAFADEYDEYEDFM